MAKLTEAIESCPGLKPVGCEVKLQSKDEWQDMAAFVV